MSYGWLTEAAILPKKEVEYIETENKTALNDLKNLVHSRRDAEKGSRNQPKTKRQRVLAPDHGEDGDADVDDSGGYFDASIHRSFKLQDTTQQTGSSGAGASSSSALGGHHSSTSKKEKEKEKERRLRIAEDEELEQKDKERKKLLAKKQRQYEELRKHGDTEAHAESLLMMSGNVGKDDFLQKMDHQLPFPAVATGGSSSAAGTDLSSTAPPVPPPGLMQQAVSKAPSAAVGQLSKVGPVAASQQQAHVAAMSKAAGLRMPPTQFQRQMQILQQMKTETNPDASSSAAASGSAVPAAALAVKLQEEHIKQVERLQGRLQLPEEEDKEAEQDAKAKAGGGPAFGAKARFAAKALKKK
eukprot:g11289.t1